MPNFEGLEQPGRGMDARPVSPVSEAREAHEEMLDRAERELAEGRLSDAVLTLERSREVLLSEVRSGLADGDRLRVRLCRIEQVLSRWRAAREDVVAELRGLRTQENYRRHEEPASQGSWLSEEA
jgi:hypothetical protein